MGSYYSNECAYFMIDKILYFITYQIYLSRFIFIKNVCFIICNIFQPFGHIVPLLDKITPYSIVTNWHMIRERALVEKSNPLYCQLNPIKPKIKSFDKGAFKKGHFKRFTATHNMGRRESFYV